MKGKNLCSCHHEANIFLFLFFPCCNFLIECLHCRKKVDNLIEHIGASCGVSL